jgi:hypothetical protein
MRICKVSGLNTWADIEVADFPHPLWYFLVTYASADLQPFTDGLVFHLAFCPFNIGLKAKVSNVQ